MSHPSHSKTEAAYNPKPSQVSQVSQVIPLSPSFAKYAQFAVSYSIFAKYAQFAVSYSIFAKYAQFAVSYSIFAKFAQFAVRYFTVFDNLRSIHGNLCKKAPRAAHYSCVSRLFDTYRCNFLR